MKAGKLIIFGRRDIKVASLSCATSQVLPLVKFFHFTVVRFFSYYELERKFYELERRFYELQRKNYEFK